MGDKKIEGLLTATFTPMKANGDIDYDRIEDYCEFLSKEGIKQIYINGSTGEGPSMTFEERKLTTECWIKAGRKNGRMTTIIVQVGGICLKDSKALAKHAESLGVDAISTLPPLYFTASTPGDLAEYCRAIAAEAPNTPMYYYHIPMRSGANINMEKFLLLSREMIPTMRGIKFTDKDLVQMCACLRTKDSKGRAFNILYGCDEQMMAALALGADGAIGSTYNWMVGTYRRLVALLGQGDVKAARVMQYRSQDVVKEIFRFGETITNGTVAPQKAIMPLVGMDLGPIRPPMKNMGSKDRDAFFKALTDLGLLDWRKELQ